MKYIIHTYMEELDKDKNEEESDEEVNEGSDKTTEDDEKLSEEEFDNEYVDEESNKNEEHDEEINEEIDWGDGRQEFELGGSGLWIVKSQTR